MQSVNTGWRTITPGKCFACGFDDSWQVDGRGNVMCDCQIEAHIDFPEDTATVIDPAGFPHVGHLTDQRDEQNGIALYYFPGDFIAGSTTEAWIDPWTAADSEALADYLSCDGAEWSAAGACLAKEKQP